MTRILGIDPGLATVGLGLIEATNAHDVKVIEWLTIETSARLPTAERILDHTLVLFNRYGEPHVSTTMISAELGISPGNLYYHFPSKDQLVNHLYDGFEASMLGLLEAGGDVQDIEDAWFFLHSLFEKVWDHRFLYRDLNHLLSGNRHLETRFHQVLERKTQTLRHSLTQLLNSVCPAQSPVTT